MRLVSNQRPWRFRSTYRIMFTLSSTEKDALRDRMLKKRAALKPIERQIASRAIISHILLHIPAGATVAGYSAIRDEVDIATLLKVLAEKGNKICLPVVTQKEAALTFRAWAPGDVMVKGSYGIMEPQQNAKPLTPDILLVPLVAFDNACHRLGYGAGYYDRTIEVLKKTNPKLKTMGIAYALQKVDKIPASKHDQKLSIVVTETGVVKPS